MRNTEQTVDTAIGELRCVSPDRTATIDELTALKIAQDCVDELLRSCVDQMRTDPAATQSWENIAYALGSDSANAIRQRFAPRSGTVDGQIEAFWLSVADELQWDFLLSDFLYALYLSWMSTEFPEDPRVSRTVFVTCLKPIATASGDWVHTRSRPGKLMSAPEPLRAAIPDWQMPDSVRAIWGLRRQHRA